MVQDARAEAYGPAQDFHDQAAGTPLGVTPASQEARRTYALKRPLDVAMAVLGLLLAAPVIVLIALAIKLEDRGPVLYSQQRWGRGGRPFLLLKFRTMVPTSDAQFGILQALPGDERITRVGQVLRATGLDELPQLINVLRGDMSVVGPRALALAEVVTISGELVSYEAVPGFVERMSVNPGITSPATVYMHKDVDPLAKFARDVGYVKEQSLWLDLRLIAISLWVSFRGKWEARESKL